MKRLISTHASDCCSSFPGAVGNLIDRAWFGQVTDFIHFR
ncbi:MAG: signal peptidase II, partial [SAR324 cluster bacterium]|nr:signal peptidase II [SAR324 cluster bacterium]